MLIGSFCFEINFAEYAFASTFAYFAWDLTLIQRLWNKLDSRNAWLVHCILCLIVFSVPTLTTYFQRQALMTLLYEISTVFMYLFQFCESWNWHKCKILNQIIFSFSFFIIRIIFGTYITIELIDPMFFNIFFSPNTIDHQCLPMFIKYLVIILNTSFHFLNLYWFIQIIQAFIAFFKGKEKYY